MYKYAFVLMILVLFVSVSTAHAQSVNLNFKEMPLQSQVCSYLTPKDIQTAYNFNSLYSNGINGKGENITIVVAYGDPNLQQDVNSYDSYYGIANLTNNSNLFVEYPFGKPNSSNSNWISETALDVEIAHSLAPGADIYLMVSPNDSYLFNTINYTIENVKTNIISLSWGSSELEYNQQSINYLNQMLAEGRSKGINIFAATGDSGAYNSYNVPNVNFPASSPNVIAVGGTTLSVYSNGEYESETAWNGSGGGQSEYFTKPSFQPNISSYRMVPDVSFNGGTPVCIYVNSNFYGFYGTSVAAPSWAALDALINQKSNSDIGYLDNSLYKIYNSLGSFVFNNITTGCNGVYCADGKYNEVTGLGSPKAFQLVQALSNTSYYIAFNDFDNGIFSVNGKNYSGKTTLKFPFGEKIELAAYPTNGNQVGEKEVFTSFSGILNSTENSTYFFVNESGTINVNFERYFHVEEQAYNGLDNRSYYVENGSFINISEPLRENYSNLQYVLRGFQINNGTLIQKSNYRIQALSALNISYFWSKQPKTVFNFENSTVGLTAEVSYYSYTPLSNIIKKSSTSIKNNSIIYAIPNSTFYVYGKPITINGNRYLTVNRTLGFSNDINVNFLKEYNYSVDFISKQGITIRPDSFYVLFNNMSEKYENSSLWAPFNVNITLYKIRYDNITLNKTISFYSDSNTKINITLPVTDFNLHVVTILGIPVVGAKITLNIKNETLSNSTNILGGVTFSNVPEILYNLTVTAYNSKFYFKNISTLPNTLSITAGLYEIYIILAIIVLILAILALYEKIRHRKNK